MKRIRAPKVVVVPAVTTETDAKEKLEDIYQVVLHNDDGVAAEHVVQCLVSVFKHDMNMAMKIMFDAHKNGRAIAEVEGESAAKQHAQQLSTAKLTVTTEKV